MLLPQVFAPHSPSAVLGYRNPSPTDPRYAGLNRASRAAMLEVNSCCPKPGVGAWPNACDVAPACPPIGGGNQSLGLSADCRAQAGQLVRSRRTKCLSPSLTWPLTISMSSSRDMNRNAPVRGSFRPSGWAGDLNRSLLPAYLNAYLYTARLFSSVTRTHSRSSLRD